MSPHLVAKLQRRLKISHVSDQRFDVGASSMILLLQWELNKIVEFIKRPQRTLALKSHRKTYFSAVKRILALCEMSEILTFFVGAGVRWYNPSTHRLSTVKNMFLCQTYERSVFCTLSLNIWRKLQIQFSGVDPRKTDVSNGCLVQILQPIDAP